MPSALNRSDLIKVVMAAARTREEKSLTVFEKLTQALELLGEMATVPMSLDRVVKRLEEHRTGGKSPGADAFLKRILEEVEKRKAETQTINSGSDKAEASTSTSSGAGIEKRPKHPEKFNDWATPEEVFKSCGIHGDPKNLPIDEILRWVSLGVSRLNVTRDEGRACMGALGSDVSNYLLSGAWSPWEWEGTPLLNRSGCRIPRDIVIQAIRREEGGIDSDAVLAVAADVLRSDLFRPYLQQLAQKGELPEALKCYARDE